MTKKSCACIISSTDRKMQYVLQRFKSGWRYMKEFLKSLVIREIQVNIMMGWSLIPVRKDYDQNHEKIARGEKDVD